MSRKRMVAVAHYGPLGDSRIKEMKKNEQGGVHMGWERSPVALRMSERIRADPLDTDAWRSVFSSRGRFRDARAERRVRHEAILVRALLRRAARRRGAARARPRRARLARPVHAFWALPRFALD